MAIRTAIILAGGFGTRLQSVVRDVPKPMAIVAGRPFLEYLLDYLKYFGVDDVVLSVGYLAEAVKTHFGEKYRGMKISYAVESEPLGTGGAIKFAFEYTRAENAFVLNGDSFFDVDLTMVETHFNRSQASGAIVLRNMEFPDRFGTVEVDGTSGLIRSFREKQPGLQLGLINTGIYILNRQLFSTFNLNERFSIEEDLFKSQIGKLKIVGFVAEGYFIDIGIPDQFAIAQKDFVGFKYTLH